MVLRRRVKWLVAIAVATAATVVLVGAWIGCDRGLHPPQKESPYVPSQFDLPLEDVHFRSRDSLRLAGWFVLGTNGATVILAHGRGGERSFMLPDANYLHKDGFSVLMFDFRYRGESEGEESTLGGEGAVGYRGCGGLSQDPIRYRPRADRRPRRFVGSGVGDPGCSRDTGDKGCGRGNPLQGPP